MVQTNPAGAAGFPTTIAPLTARLACRITTDRRSAGISAPALADELLDLVARYVDEVPVEALDPRVQAIVAKAALRALELVEQRTAAARAAKRAAKRAADDLVVVLDPDQQDLEAAGVPLFGGRHMNKASERDEAADGRRGAYLVPKAVRA